MSATGQPAEGGGAPEGTGGAVEAGPGPDISAVMDRVGEIASGLGELQSGFQEFVQGQQPPAPQEPDPWESLFGPDPQAQAQQQVDQFGQPVQAQPQQPPLDPAALQQAVDQRVQQALGPFAAQFQQFQQQQQLADLYKAVPQLADTPENAQVRQETAQRVQDALQGAPPDAAAWLSNSPAFIQTVFKAAEADRLAQAQEPAGGPQVLEGGGATPGGTGGQGQSIVEQAMASRFQTPAGWR